MGGGEYVYTGHLNLGYLSIFVHASGLIDCRCTGRCQYTSETNKVIYKILIPIKLQQWVNAEILTKINLGTFLSTYLFKAYNT